MTTNKPTQQTALRFDCVDTLASARRDWQFESPPDSCPCCGRPRGVGRTRTLYSSMARSLYEIARFFARNPEQRSVHAISYLVGLEGYDPKVKAGMTGGTHSKPVHWGLLEEDSDTGRGYYRMTDLGWRFVRGEVSVPKKLDIAKGGRVVARSVEEVALRQAANLKFDLDEVRSSVR